MSSDREFQEIAGRDYAVSERGPKRFPSLDAGESAWGEIDQLVMRLREALMPYVRAGRFRGVVLPLPRSVGASAPVLAAVARIADRLEGMPLLVEPRDGSWVKQAAIDFLREAGVGLVLADGPDPEGPALGPDRGGPRPLPARRLSPFAPVTTDIAYVRFHGRDGELRWAGGAARRDYLYSWEELVSWLPTLRALAARAREVVVVFNNPWRERAIENVRMMRRLVGEERQSQRLELGRFDRRDSGSKPSQENPGPTSLRRGPSPEAPHDVPSPASPRSSPSSEAPHSNANSNPGPLPERPSPTSPLENDTPPAASFTDSDAPYDRELPDRQSPGHERSNERHWEPAWDTDAHADGHADDHADAHADDDAGTDAPRAARSQNEDEPW